MPSLMPLKLLRIDFTGSGSIIAPLKPSVPCIPLKMAGNGIRPFTALPPHLTADHPRLGAARPDFNPIFDFQKEKVANKKKKYKVYI